MGLTDGYRFAYVALFATASLWSNWGVRVAGMEVLYGTVVMTVAYGLLDVVHQRAGTDIAQQTVRWAASARAVWFFVAGAMSLVFPALSPLLMASVVFFLAGEAGMLVSQYCVDIPLFAALRRHTTAPFWVRYIVSTLLSQQISTAVFAAAVSLTLGKSFTALFLGGLVLRGIVVPVVMAPAMARLARA